MDAQPARQTLESRRATTLAAAALVFARNGYHGTTTDQIAREAGISQPYVVRMFGTKRELFLAVSDAALRQILDKFQEALTSGQGPTRQRLGSAYTDLATHTVVHLLLTHAFVLGEDPAIGPAARRGFSEILAFLQEEAGLDEEESVEFLARGMLINTVLGLRMSDAEDPRTRSFTRKVLDSPPVGSSS